MILNDFATFIVTEPSRSSEAFDERKKVIKVTLEEHEIEGEGSASKPALARPQELSIGDRDLSGWGAAGDTLFAHS